MRPNAKDELDMLSIEIGKIVGMFCCQYVVRYKAGLSGMHELIRMSHRRMGMAPCNPFYLGV